MAVAVRLRADVTTDIAWLERRNVNEGRDGEGSECVVIGGAG